MVTGAAGDWETCISSSASNMRRSATVYYGAESSLAENSFNTVLCTQWAYKLTMPPNRGLFLGGGRLPPQRGENQAEAAKTRHGGPSMVSPSHGSSISMGSQSTGNPSGRSMSMGVGPRQIPRRGRGWGGREDEVTFCARRRDFFARENALDFILKKKDKR
jgi:hypothetical protein